ncbi:hypothetical protein PanWU01x14_351820, partial [Parasponia andersonii]
GIGLKRNGDLNRPSNRPRSELQLGDDSASSNQSSAHYRSRSLSRFSHWLLALGTDGFNEAPAAPRGRFVNTIRGTWFPKISLDNLAVEFFESSGDRGRSGSRNSDVSPKSGPTASQR